MKFVSFFIAPQVPSECAAQTSRRLVFPLPLPFEIVKDFKDRGWGGANNREQGQMTEHTNPRGTYYLWSQTKKHSRNVKPIIMLPWQAVRLNHCFLPADESFAASPAKCVPLFAAALELKK
jgi:hypothetical protein